MSCSKPIVIPVTDHGYKSRAQLDSSAGATDQQILEDFSLPKSIPLARSSSSDFETTLRDTSPTVWASPWSDFDETRLSSSDTPEFWCCNEAGPEHWSHQATESQPSMRLGLSIATDSPCIRPSFPASTAYVDSIPHMDYLNLGTQFDYTEGSTHASPATVAKVLTSTITRQLGSMSPPSGHVRDTELQYRASSVQVAPAPC